MPSRSLARTLLTLVVLACVCTSSATATATVADPTPNADAADRELPAYFPTERAETS